MSLIPCWPLPDVRVFFWMEARKKSKFSQGDEVSLSHSCLLFTETSVGVEETIPLDPFCRMSWLRFIKFVLCVWVFNTIAKKYRICSTFTDFNDLSNVGEAIRKNIKLIWAENPTDPTLNIIDFCGLANITKDKNILLAVNNTFLTPYLQRPLELSTDIVMQSMTKYMNGHSDTVMGNLSMNKDLLFGMISAPFDCYQTLRGLKI
ncbi:hypothetical protein NQ318_016925 [Aromia moschata]|uniref:cystathionine gamma-lyase n=1 Tax=Aromia moschata TaxID=1265417 RepID=A0AAV8X5K7_9CUCU|nr:hypothetical protein NQ318_016925 [Aromia moschata]